MLISLTPENILLDYSLIDSLTNVVRCATESKSTTCKVLVVEICKVTHNVMGLEPPLDL